MFSIIGMFGREQARAARKASSPRSSSYTAPGKSTLSQILRLLALSVEQGRPGSPSFHLSLSYGETRNINQPHQCGGTEDKALSPIQKDLFGCSNDCSLSPICQRSEPGLANTACCSALSLFAESAATPVRKHMVTLSRTSSALTYLTPLEKKRKNQHLYFHQPELAHCQRLWCHQNHCQRVKGAWQQCACCRKLTTTSTALAQALKQSPTSAHRMWQTLHRQSCAHWCFQVPMFPPNLVIVSRENVRSKKITNIVQHKHV